MYKNNIDIEKLENLPFKEKIWEKQWEAGWDYSRFYSSHKYHKACKIFYNSVGRPLSSLKRRLDPLLKNYKISFNEFVRKHTMLMVYVDSDWITPFFKTRYSYYYPYFNCYYVDENNCLQYLKREQKKYKQIKTSKQYWKFIQERNISDRTHKMIQEKQSLILLRMINKPELYQYYVKIKKEYNDLFEQIIETKNRIKEEFGKNNREKFNLKHFELNQIKEKTPILNKLKIKIDLLENGEFSTFYESNEYLFSLSKECPHFENTKL